MQWVYEVVKTTDPIGVGYSDEQFIKASCGSATDIYLYYCGHGAWVMRYVSGNTIIPIYLDVPRVGFDHWVPKSVFGPRCLVRIDRNQDKRLSIAKGFDASVFYAQVSSLLFDLHECQLIVRRASPRMEVVEFSSELANELQIDPKIITANEKTKNDDYGELELGGEQSTSAKIEVPTDSEHWLFRQYQTLVRHMDLPSAGIIPEFSPYVFYNKSNAGVMRIYPVMGLQISYSYLGNLLRASLLGVDYDKQKNHFTLKNLHGENSAKAYFELLSDELNNDWDMSIFLENMFTFLADLSSGKIVMSRTSTFSLDTRKLKLLFHEPFNETNLDLRFFPRIVT